MCGNIQCRIFNVTTYLEMIKDYLFMLLVRHYCIQLSCILPLNLKTSKLDLQHMLTYP